VREYDESVIGRSHASQFSAQARRPSQHHAAGP
jgi:hypothetical protein